MVIHRPPGVDISPDGPVKPEPRMKYLMTMMPSPDRNVNIAPQRKKNSTRGISSGTTFFFVSASIVPVKGMLMKLKK